MSIKAVLLALRQRNRCHACRTTLGAGTSVPASDGPGGASAIVRADHARARTLPLETCTPPPHPGARRQPKRTSVAYLRTICFFFLMKSWYTQNPPHNTEKMPYSTAAHERWCATVCARTRVRGSGHNNRAAMSDQMLRERHPPPPMCPCARGFAHERRPTQQQKGNRRSARDSVRRHGDRCAILGPPTRDVPHHNDQQTSIHVGAEPPRDWQPNNNNNKNKRLHTTCANAPLPVNEAEAWSACVEFVTPTRTYSLSLSATMARKPVMMKPKMHQIVQQIEHIRLPQQQ